MTNATTDFYFLVSSYVVVCKLFNTALLPNHQRTIFYLRMKRNRLAVGLCAPPNLVQGVGRERKGEEEKEVSEGEWTPQFLKRGCAPGTNPARCH